MESPVSWPLQPMESSVFCVPSFLDTPKKVILKFTVCPNVALEANLYALITATEAEKNPFITATDVEKTQTLLITALMLVPELSAYLCLIRSVKINVPDVCKFSGILDISKLTGLPDAHLSAGPTDACKPASLPDILKPITHLGYYKPTDLSGV